VIEDNLLVLDLLGVSELEGTSGEVGTRQYQPASFSKSLSGEDREDASDGSMPPNARER